MLRGDYAGALAAYRGVADIADLEPGLLPASMRREAAASAVTGGAASVQVARLVRECEQRVRQRVTEPLCRPCGSRLGVDAVLGCSGAQSAVPLLLRGENDVLVSVVDDSVRGGRRRQSRTQGGRCRPRFAESRERFVVRLPVGHGALHCVLPSRPAWVHDQLGLLWRLPRIRGDGPLKPVWQGMTMALGSAGFIASASFLPFAEVHPVVAKAIQSAPAGPMSGALRSAAPVCGPSPAQEAAMEAALVKHRQLRHPNVLPLLGYSHSVEGGVVLLWEFSPGGTIREVLTRYGHLPYITQTQFGLHMLSALAYLHERGVAHGNLSIDTVVVDADGKCRLVGLCLHERSPFVQSQSHHVSPWIAAGGAPTPPCDVFCYGLMVLEGLTGQPCWRWRTDDDGEPLGTMEALLQLIEKRGQDLRDAVAQGRLVSNADALDAPVFADKYSVLARTMLRRCVSHTPAERPTAVEARDVIKTLLSQVGLDCEEDEA
ncbi:protein kinase [Novymonas esmeraldas]|uniref:Protein kinase n=1 Tax=Novymonas esmeraldas TaxID=1808958 RepID=A0AAW0EYS7_9TRYP